MEKQEEVAKEMAEEGAAGHSAYTTWDTAGTDPEAVKVMFMVLVL